MPRISVYPPMTRLLGPEIFLGDQGGQTGISTATQIAAFVAAGITLAGLGGLPAASFTQANIAQLLFPQTAVEITNAVVPLSYQYPPYTTFRYMTAAQILDVQTGGLATDCGPIFQLLSNLRQASGATYSYAQPGTYGFKTGFTSQYPGVYDYTDAVFVPTMTGAVPFLWQWQAGFSTVFFPQIQGNYNTYLGAALLWNSLGTFTPAQSNQFFNVVINRTTNGFVFGSLTGTPASAVQSENYITGCHITSCQAPVTVNQPNGILTISGGGVLNCDGGGWPGNVLPTPAASYVLTIASGAFESTDIAMEKPGTTLGQGVVNSGGTLQIKGGSHEIACQPLLLAGGTTRWLDCGGMYYDNATQSFCLLNGALTTAPSLVIDNTVVNKDVGTSAANTAVIDLGGYTGWDIKITNSRFENFLHLLFGNGSAQPEVWNAGLNNVHIKNTSCPLVGAGTAPLYSYVDMGTENLLDLHNTDVDGLDPTTWYSTDLTGAGTVTGNADTPNAVYPSCYQNSATGNSIFSNLNTSSLANCKATGIKCRTGDLLQVQGWFKTTTAGTASVGMAFANSVGAYSSFVPVASQANYVGTVWTYISGFVIAPLTGYAAVGMSLSAVVGRMTGLRAGRLQP